MNRRSNERIPMKLPCLLTFSGEFKMSIPGMTANMHRDGILLSTTASLPAALPRIGAPCKVHVELPPNPQFGPKCIVCDCMLVRMETGSTAGSQFALQIASVAFRDMELNTAYLAESRNLDANLPF